jgi:hypothetical protein
MLEDEEHMPTLATSRRSTRSCATKPAAMLLRRRAETAVFREKYMAAVNVMGKVYSKLTGGNSCSVQRLIGESNGMKTRNA